MYFLIYHLSLQTLRVLTVTQCYIIITTTASVGLIIPRWGQLGTVTQSPSRPIFAHFYTVWRPVVSVVGLMIPRWGHITTHTQSSSPPLIAQHYTQLIGKVLITVPQISCIGILEKKYTDTTSKDLQLHVAIYSYIST